MEPEQTPEVLNEKGPSLWNTVTPFSKYLAMVLFVVLPFIGGWVGYQVAPTEIVTETIVIEVDAEKTPQKEIDSTTLTDSDNQDSLYCELPYVTNEGSVTSKMVWVSNEADKWLCDDAVWEAHMPLRYKTSIGDVMLLELPPPPKGGAVFTELFSLNPETSEFRSLDLILNDFRKMYDYGDDGIDFVVFGILDSPTQSPSNGKIHKAYLITISNDLEVSTKSVYEFAANETLCSVGHGCGVVVSTSNGYPLGHTDTFVVNVYNEELLEGDLAKKLEFRYDRETRRLTLAE